MYIISLFLQLGHSCLQCCRDLSMQLGIFASQLTGVLKQSNDVNAAKMLIVLQSGRKSFCIQLTAKPVTAS